MAPHHQNPLHQISLQLLDYIARRVGNDIFGLIYISTNLTIYYAVKIIPDVLTGTFARERYITRTILPQLSP